jgi:hypothetical protein
LIQSILSILLILMSLYDQSHLYWSPFQQRRLDQ